MRVYIMMLKVSVEYALLSIYICTYELVNDMGLNNSTVLLSILIPFLLSSR